MKNNKVLKYIEKHYYYKEPILTKELKYHLNMSDNAIRQNIKKLYDSGELKRVKPGIYFRPKPNSLLKNPTISISRIIEEKYLYDGKKRVGYLSGINFANKIGLTTQTASIETVVSNKVADKKRIVTIGNNRVSIESPRVKITEDNYRLLQVLDLFTNFYSVSEVSLLEARREILVYLDGIILNTMEIENCIENYPLKTQLNFYKAGLFYELTQGFRAF